MNIEHEQGEMKLYTIRFNFLGLLTLTGTDWQTLSFFISHFWVSLAQYWTYSQWFILNHEKWRNNLKTTMVETTNWKTLGYIFSFTENNFVHINFILNKFGCFWIFYRHLRLSFPNYGSTNINLHLLLSAGTAHVWLRCRSRSTASSTWCRWSTAGTWLTGR